MKGTDASGMTLDAATWEVGRGGEGRGGDQRRSSRAVEGANELEVKVGMRGRPRADQPGK